MDFAIGKEDSFRSGIIRAAVLKASVIAGLILSNSRSPAAQNRAGRGGSYARHQNSKKLAGPEAWDYVQPFDSAEIQRLCTFTAPPTHTMVVWHANDGAIA